MQDHSTDSLFGRIVQTSEGKFEAPEAIIKDVSAARSMYEKFRANNLKRVALQAAIEGLLQGNPPYNPSDLRKAGLEHIANFNDMSALAVFERYCLSYWNLLNSSEYLVNFTVRLDSPEDVHIGNVLSANWDFAVKELWPSFLINVASLQAQLVKFGMSPVLFSDERDPRWKVIELSKFLVPDETQSDLDMLTTVMVESEFTVQYLWQIFLTFKDKPKEESPWNTRELGIVLSWLANSPEKDTILPQDLFELERKLMSGDVSFDRMFTDSIKMISLFQREYGGGISHYMFHRNFTYGNNVPSGAFLTPEGKGKPVDEEHIRESFIFFAGNQYKTMNEAVVIFTMNPGCFVLNQNKGVGHKIFSLAQAKTQSVNSLVDMGKWASTPIIKSPSLVTKEAEAIRWYPGVATNIGNNEFAQNNLGANIQGVVGVGNYLDAQIRENLTYSGSDPSSPDPSTGSLSPSQTKLAAFKEFSVLKNYVMHFYATFDRLIKNMTNIMWHSKDSWPAHEISKLWKERCIQDGVPPEIFDLKAEKGKLPPQITVAATRAAGAGSQVAHLIGLQELQTIAGSFGPREEKEYKRQFIMATVGPEYVAAFLQEADDDDSSAGGASLAAVENAVMQAGKSPQFSPDNDQRAHVVTHFALAQMIIQQLQQQEMSPIQADSIFNVLIPHLEEHMNALVNNIFAKSFYERMITPFNEVKRYATLNRKNAAKQVQANLSKENEAKQKQQEAMTEEQLKTFTTMKDEQRKDFKMQKQEERQAGASEAKESALARKTEGDLAIKKRQVEGELEIKAKGEQTKQADYLTNTSEADAASNPSEYLENLNGNTPSPYDIESA